MILTLAAQTVHGLSVQFPCAAQTVAEADHTKEAVYGGESFCAKAVAYHGHTMNPIPIPKLQAALTWTSLPPCCVESGVFVRVTLKGSPATDATQF